MWKEHYKATYADTTVLIGMHHILVIIFLLIRQEKGQKVRLRCQEAAPPPIRCNDVVAIQHILQGGGGGVGGCLSAG